MCLCRLHGFQIDNEFLHIFIQNRFIPATPTDIPNSRSLHNENKQIAFKKPQKLKEQRFPKQVMFCEKSLEIPGMLEMNGRLGVITWESGLDDFSDEVSLYVIKAIHVSNRSRSRVSDRSYHSLQLNESKSADNNDVKLMLFYEITSCVLDE